MNAIFLNSVHQFSLIILELVKVSNVEQYVKNSIWLAGSNPEAVHSNSKIYINF